MRLRLDCVHIAPLMRLRQVAPPPQGRSSLAAVRKARAVGRARKRDIGKQKREWVCFGAAPPPAQREGASRVRGGNERPVARATGAPAWSLRSRAKSGDARRAGIGWRSAGGPPAGVGAGGNHRPRATSARAAPRTSARRGPPGAKPPCAPRDLGKLLATDAGRTNRTKGSTAARPRRERRGGTRRAGAAREQTKEAPAAPASTAPKRQSAAIRLGVANPGGASRAPDLVGSRPWRVNSAISFFRAAMSFFCANRVLTENTKCSDCARNYPKCHFPDLHVVVVYKRTVLRFPPESAIPLKR
jgi:hypothetical protein